MDLLLLAPVGSIIALGFAAYSASNILKLSEGTERMKEIASAVREGAKAYLKRQYFIVSIFFASIFVALLVMAMLDLVVIFTPFAFLTGGFYSGLSGFIGMTIATQSGSRTANAARKSLNLGLRVAFSSGTVMGLTVVGLGLLDLSIWYYFLNWYYSVYPLPGGVADKIGAITSVMLSCGMGASSMALFARVGGGIFTKAADVGADLVGKTEAGIPEDDPRNPAVIADNVGDNVGDVAGMGADLYESYVGAIVSTSALAVAAGLGKGGVTVPMTIAALGIVASIIGTFFVRSKEQAEQGALLAALRRGTFTSAMLIAILSFFIIRSVLGMQYIGVYWAILIGLVAGVLIGLSTEYFTSDRYHPTKTIADASVTGPATVIIAGLGVGMLSTAIPVIIVGIAILFSYYLPIVIATANGVVFLSNVHQLNVGLYGVAASAVGMLSTLGITLATDAYGPVADNAGGNAQMSHLEPEVRKRTDALDSLGNTTAATGKGFAIGSAALTSLALIAAYKSQVEIVAARLNIHLDMALDLSIINPRVIAGLFIGGMLPFFFSSLTMRAVGRTAQGIVKEVRRQFREIPGIMEGSAKPDYARCVRISTAGAQKEMIAPSILAVCSPIVVGITMGIEALIGLLTGSLVSGFVLAVMMANAGGALDNAKKYIEGGKHEGKGSYAHKAAVVGDTVGDPLKDTSGPSLNILLKLMPIVSIVFAGLILKYTIYP